MSVARMLGTPTSVNQSIKQVTDIVRRSNLAGRLLFLRILDEREQLEADVSAAVSGEFLELLPGRADSDRSWTISRGEIEASKCDLKALNPNTRNDEDARTPEELLDLIEAKGREVDAAIAALRASPTES